MPNVEKCKNKNKYDDIIYWQTKYKNDNISSRFFGGRKRQNLPP